jgi:hypothetical protein
MPRPSVKELLRIPVKAGDERFLEDLAPHLGIDFHDPEALNKALADYPSRYAWWSRLEAEARIAEERRSNELEETRARLFPLLEQEAKESGARTALDALRYRMIQHAEYREALDRYEQAKADLLRVQVGRKALEAQRETLITLSLNLRAEMDSRLGFRQTTEPQFALTPPKLPSVPPPLRRPSRPPDREST